MLGRRGVQERLELGLKAWAGSTLLRDMCLGPHSCLLLGPSDLGSTKETRL
jgi:hypothetical protein